MKGLSYKPLWKTMEKKKITQFDLIEKHGIDNKTLQKIKQNKNITMTTLMKLCDAVSAKPNDVIAFVETEE